MQRHSTVFEAELPRPLSTAENVAEAQNRDLGSRSLDCAGKPPFFSNLQGYILIYSNPIQPLNPLPLPLPNPPTPQKTPETRFEAAAQLNKEPYLLDGLQVCSRYFSYTCFFFLKKKKKAAAANS